MSLTQNLAESCTTYMTCGLWLHLSELNWGAVGATILLIARLVKDVPEAYHAIKKHFAKNKRKKPRVKSKR